MKIKTPTEFLTFNDGYCDIFEVKGNQLGEKKMTLCYGDRTVGMKRYFAARTATVEINRLIHVPRQLSITAKDNVMIGTARYKIEQVQHLNDTNPPATVLTLRQIGAIQ
jgi:hypothetical protein